MIIEFSDRSVNQFGFLSFGNLTEKWVERKLSKLISPYITCLTETIQVLELGTGYKILTIYTTFHCKFFSFL